MVKINDKVNRETINIKSVNAIIKSYISKLKAKTIIAYKFPEPIYEKFIKDTKNSNLI